MSETSERVAKQDAVLMEFTRGLFLWERDGERQRRMADEIVRLRAILAALREPSATVVDETWNALDEYDGEMYGLIRHTIRAAVAAAEQEVGRE